MLAQFGYIGEHCVKTDTEHLLNYDLSSNDVAMRRWGSRLRDDLKVPHLESLCLATTIFNEIRTLPDLHGFAEAEANETISFFDRFNELAIYMQFQANRSAESAFDPVDGRSRLVLANYICFVYLGESCFLKLRKLTKTGSTSRKCLEYLTSGRVRWFRNAVAHANWSIADGTITYWSKKGSGNDEQLHRFTVEDEERGFWFYLSLCVATSSFAALTEAGLTQHVAG